MSKTPDLFLLDQLSNGVTIGKAVYYVAWNSREDVAVIWVAPLDTDDPLEELCLDLLDEDGVPLAFSSELEAHAFLNGLKRENE